MRDAKSTLANRLGTERPRSIYNLLVFPTGATRTRAIKERWHSLTSTPDRRQAEKGRRQVLGEQADLLEDQLANLFEQACDGRLMRLGPLREIAVELDALHPATEFVMKRWVRPALARSRSQYAALRDITPFVVQVMIPVGDVNATSVAFGRAVRGRPLVRVHGRRIRAGWDTDKLVDHAVLTLLFGAEGVLEFWQLTALWAGLCRSERARAIVERFPSRGEFFRSLKRDLGAELNDDGLRDEAFASELAVAYFQTMIEGRHDRKKDLDEGILARLEDDNIGTGVQSLRAKRRPVRVQHILDGLYEGGDEGEHIGLDDAGKLARAFSTEDRWPDELVYEDARLAADN